MIMSTRALALFLISLLVVSWGFQGAALHIVGDVESEAIFPWLVGMMFLPSLWSIAYLALFNRKAFKLIQAWPRNPVYLVLAALVPAGIAFTVLAILMQQGWGGSSYFSFATDSVTVLRGPWIMGDGAQDWGFFLANVAGTALLFGVLNSIAAVGEEFGWRGVLQHHMIERFGFLRGVAVLGFVWAIWHAPVNLAGYNHPEAPAFGTFVLFPIQLMAISFVMAWITLRARSFWPAVVMHASGNGIEEGLMSSFTLVGVPPLMADYLNIAVTIALALVCIAFTPRQRETLAIAGANQPNAS